MSNVEDRPLAEIVEALRTMLCQVAEPNAVLQAILQQAVVRTGADRGLIAEVLNDGALEYRVTHGFKGDHFRGDVGAFSRSLFHRVVESGEELVLDRAADDPYWNSVPSVRSLQTAAILCMPIRIGDEVGAVVHLENRRAGHFRARHLELLRSLLAVASPVMESMRVGRELLSERDSLRQEADESRALLARDWLFGRFVGRSAAVRSLESSVRQAAATDAPVVLHGETGTGKGILARVIHHSGSRADRPFVTAACPNFSKDMVESELFGHCKGAFTSALMDRIGKAQAADGGTLFLDEIGDLPLEIQPKLLRFLDKGTFERVGESRERTVHVRIVSATNKDLDEEIRHGRFRRDLFARLNFHPVRVPPLRERREDIPLLLRYCLDRRPSGRWIELAPDAIDFLRHRESRWPGNVREVEQLAARIVGEAATEGIRPVSARDVERLLGSSNDSYGAAEDEPAAETGLKEQKESAERALITKTLRENPGVTRVQLAQKLGISVAALYVKLRKLGISGQDKAP
ncbi:MAG: sigma 54-interacting transcriptional regulator [Candidatus Eiseniibacteriota bacterium]